MVDRGDGWRKGGEVGEKEVRMVDRRGGWWTG